MTDQSTTPDPRRRSHYGRTLALGGMLALGIALGTAFGGAAEAQNSGLVQGRYSITWAADGGSGTEDICLSDMQHFSDPAHIAAIFFNNYESTCSSRPRGGGVYDVSCTGQLVEGTLTVLGSGPYSMSVSGGILAQTDNMGGRRRTTVRLSATRQGECPPKS